MCQQISNLYLSRNKTHNKHEDSCFCALLIRQNFLGRLCADAKHGGKRLEKFTIWQHKIIRLYLFMLCEPIQPGELFRTWQSYPQLGLMWVVNWYEKSFLKNGSGVGKNQPQVQLHKFSQGNRERYASHIDWLMTLSNIDLQSVKFMDEVHFVSKNKNIYIPYFGDTLWYPLNMTKKISWTDNYSSIFSVLK